MFKRRENLISDLVPVEDHVTDQAVILTGGAVAAMFEVEGLPWETADAGDVNDWHDRLNLTIRNVASDQLCITVYQTRGLASPGGYPRGTFRSAFAEAFDLQYRERLYDRALYTNRLFISLEVRPPQPAGEWLGEQLAKRSRKAGDRPEDRLRKLDDICALLQSELKQYRPRRLGLVERGMAVYSEIAEAFVYAATGVWRQIGLTTGRLGDVCFSEDVTIGHEAIEIRGPGHTVFAALLGLREYPAKTWPGLFDSLLAAPYRYTLAQTFRCFNKAEGTGVLTRKQNKMIYAGDKALSQVAGLSVAADKLMSNEFVMGEHGAALCVFAGSPSALNDVATEAWKGLADSGAVVVREGKALAAAWLSLIPGNSRFHVRPGALSSRNFAAMASLHNYPQGLKRSRWGGPIALLRTTGGTPFRFHWHDGADDAAVGNTLITGTTGSGKTLTTGMLILMTAGRAGVIALDHKRGWEVLIRAMQGDYAVLGDGRSHFAPLKALDASPRNIEFITNTLRGCIRQGGWRDLTGQEDSQLALGVQTVMSLPPADRSIAEVRAFLGSEIEGAGTRLEKWCAGGELGWVLDAPHDAMSLDGDLHGLDTTALLNNERARGPAMLYIFHRIGLRLDGRPLLVPIDEGWRALLDDVFRPMIEQALRTIRSKNGAVVFITQSPSDPVQSGIAAALTEMCPTQIHFPSPGAQERHYTEGLKRTKGEFAALRTLQKGSGMFLLCQGDRSMVAQLPLYGMDDDIAVLSASETNVRLLDSMPPEVLDDPPRLLAEFHARRRLTSQEEAV